MCREGVLGQDADLAKWLRKNCSTPVLLAANKAERRGASGSSGMCWFTQAVFIYRSLLFSPSTQAEPTAQVYKDDRIADFSCPDCIEASFQHPATISNPVCCISRLQYSCAWLHSTSSRSAPLLHNVRDCPSVTQNPFPESNMASLPHTAMKITRFSVP